MGFNDETTEQLVRQVRIDLRFLKRAIEALDDKISTRKSADLKLAVAAWLDTFFVEESKPCPACMGDDGDCHFDPKALDELLGARK